MTKPLLLPLSASTFAMVLSLTAALGLAFPSPGDAAQGDARIASRLLLANPTISEPRLSPNGRHIAFVYSRDDRQRVFVRPSVGEETVGLAEFPLEKVRLSRLWWANNERVLLEGLSPDPRLKQGGPLTKRIYAVNRERPRIKWLGRNWPDRGLDWARAQVAMPDRILHLVRDDRDNVLLSHLGVGETTPRVSRMSVYSGRLREVQESLPGVQTFFADAAGRVRAAEAIGRSADGRSDSLLARVEASSELTVVSESADHAASDMRFAGFHDDPGRLYVLAPREGRDALFEFDIATQSLGEEVYAHAEFDVVGVETSPFDGRVVGARFEAEAPEVAYFDEVAGKEQALIARSLTSADAGTNIHRIVSATRNGEIAMVMAEGDARPPSYYAYHRERKEMNLVFDGHPGIETDGLAVREAIEVGMPDASKRSGFLTRPSNSAAEPPALVVIAPEGPGDRALRGFDPLVQFFANRGFAVLELNTVGSRGFGRAFAAAGLEGWGMAMNRDLDDAVRALAAEGKVDAGRVVIYGRGFGGTLAVRALAGAPDLYRAGASYGGIMDFDAQWQANAEPLLGFAAAAQPDTRSGASPSELAAGIEVPVLLGHGGRDAVVAIEQGRRFAATLESAGKQVDFVEYEAEYDGFALERSRVDFHDRVIALFEGAVAAPVASPDPGASTTTPSPETAPESGGDAEPEAAPDAAEETLEVTSPVAEPVAE
ncbi:MAG: prolyl oligopeptidase family serine peptidase [Myxococcota bacterium]|nr:prolyl oligopeptidase family serine peptidase [Myxococcota bacterium]